MPSDTSGDFITYNDIESIEYQKSEVLEGVILDFGDILYRSLMDAVRDDEISALRELIGEFTLLASAYSSSTGRLREDLGVGLNEAVELKLSAIRKNPVSSNSEWRHYASGTKRLLDMMRRE